MLDPFCGCATTLVGAHARGREWVGIDISEKAAELVVTLITDQQGALGTDDVSRTVATAVSKEAVRAAPCHHQKRSCSISTNRSSTAYTGSPANGAPMPNVLTYTSGNTVGLAS